mgnify:CR=1 FL=1
MRKEMLKKSIGTIVMTIALVGTSIPGVTVSPVKVNADVATTVSASSNEVGKLESIFTTIDLMDASISELETAMEKGELTAEQLVQMYIDRINAYDKSLDLNSIITINSKALDEAKELDKERAAGKIKGKLHGIPIIVKDNYDVEGMPTSAGCKALKDSIAPDDSYAVKKLKEEGAIILAKANMSEFASSGRNSRSTLGGVVHNPYDVTRTPAGSSGGTAVAITSNFATAGLGTDTGSSVRAPSTMNNLFGLRVSLGLTSRDGIVPLSLDNDIAGPICKSAEDLAQVLSVISGTDENDTWTKESDNMKPENGYTSYLKTDGLKGKKIGYLQNSFGYYYNNKGEAVENPVEIADCEKGILETAKDNLVKGGAELVDMSDILPDSLIYQLRQNTSVGSVFEWDLNTYFASLGPAAPIKTAYELINNYKYGEDYTNISIRNPIEDFSTMANPRTTENWQSCWNGMVNFRTTISNILKEQDIDAVAYVSQTDVADIETTSNNKNNAASYINYFGPVAGLPDMMIPMGFAKTDPDNGYETEMPLGMSLFTSYGNEEKLIEIAYSYEQTAGESIRKQPSTVPALEDKNVDKFLDELIDKTDSIDFSEYTVYPNGKVNVLLNKYAEATEVDRSDVYETYEATYDLAKAYDSLMNKLLANKKVTTPATDKTPTANTSTVTTPTIETVSAPAKAKISKITKAKKSMKIAIRKPAGVKGYQIKYSTSKKFVAKKTKTVTTSKATVTVKKINVKKTYYVKVRAYKLIDGKVTYGAYSKVKKVS